MAEKGVSASAAVAHLCVSSVTFAKLLNQGVFERKPRHIGYDLNTIRSANFGSSKPLRLVAAVRTAAICYRSSAPGLRRRRPVRRK